MSRHNAQEKVCDKFYKDGVGYVLTYYLDPKKHKYVPLVGDIENIDFNRHVLSTKYNKMGLEQRCRGWGYTDIEEHFHKYFERLGKKKKLKDGNCGYTIVGDTVYFIGQFYE